jgi:hypothetical protein
MDALWGVDRQSGKLVSLAWTGSSAKDSSSAALYVADDVSTTRVTFVQAPLLAPPWAPNRFRYAVSGGSLSIAWEVQRDGSWREGDHLQCTRA